MIGYDSTGTRTRALLQPARDLGTGVGDSGMCILYHSIMWKSVRYIYQHKTQKNKVYCWYVKAPIEIEVLRVLTARMWIYGK